MADLKTIKGFTIQSLASDPSNPIEGQVWYNTTSTTLKGEILSIPSGAWSSGGTRTTGTNSGAGAGTQTAYVTFGGNTEPAPTQIYNGTGWTTNPTTLNSTRYLMAGFGTSTAAVSAGGAAPTTGETEIFDGTSWSEVNNLNEACSHTSGCGTSAAGIKTAGDIPSESPPLSGSSETWNGTSWTEITAMSSGRTNTATGGTQTSCLVMGGAQVPANFGKVEEYNGSTWSEVDDLNSPRSHFGAATDGTVASMICFGGTSQPGAVVQKVTEAYNGSTWSEIADQGTATNYNTGGGSSSVAINCGGGPGATDQIVEEWNATGSSTVTFTSS